MYARMRERIHFVHHKRRYLFPSAFLVPPLPRSVVFVQAHPLTIVRCRFFPASEKCQHEKRKTVNGEDILFAMTSLGFENYAEALKIYLTKYREVSHSFYFFPFLFFFRVGFSPRPSVAGIRKVWERSRLLNQFDEDFNQDSRHNPREETINNDREVAMGR